MPLRVSAVLWDFDDTLVDSLPLRVNALTQALRDVEIEGVDPRHVLLNLGDKTLGESLALLAERHGKPPDLYDRYRSIYGANGSRLLRLYPGVDEVLCELERRGVPMAVVTQKYRYFEVEGVLAGAAVELEGLGLTGRIPVLIGIDDVTKTKPHPEGVLKALRQLGVPPERALMVGDTLADIGAAKAAGCWSCLATWGVPDPAERAAIAQPEFVAETPADLLDILGFADGSGQA